jgi:D-3-phosphoglycerate dehydrogenase
MTTAQRRVFRVVLTDGALPGDGRLERELLAQSGLDVVLERHECRDPGELRRICEGADALVVSFAQVPAAVIDAMPGCRIIAFMATGYDSVDLEHATSRGIAVTNAGPYCSNEVADHAMALLLMLARRIPDLCDGVRRGAWSSSVCGSPGTLREQTLGIVGLGRIGSRVALRAAAFGLTIIATDPNVDRSAMELLGVEKGDLAELLTRSDYVTLHCSLTSETRTMIDARALSLLKPTAYFVNTARGECVETRALVKALEQGDLAGAALDVVAPEPLPAGHPLLALPNVVLTPHAAFHSQRSINALRAAPFAAVAEALAGREPPFIVNPEVLRQDNCRIGVSS